MTSHSSVDEITEQLTTTSINGETITSETRINSSLVIRSTNNNEGPDAKTRHFVVLSDIKQEGTNKKIWNKIDNKHIKDQTPPSTQILDEARRAASSGTRAEEEARAHNQKYDRQHPPSTPANRSSRYYCVPRTATDYEYLLGIHVCAWQQLENLLPGKKLVGSGCHAKGFSNWADAEGYWYEEGHTCQPMRKNHH